MSRLYCYKCESAGSVNKWGFCEICGAEYNNTKLSDDLFKRFDYFSEASQKAKAMENSDGKFETKEPVASIKQDAA